MIYNLLKVPAVASILAINTTSTHAMDCDTVREDAITCMACNIYHEARNQSIEGQIAVAHVTQNRLASTKFPDTLCKVVWQHRQFSWTKDGKSDKIYEKRSWYLAQSIALAITESNVFPDVTKGAVFYHTNEINPKWNRNMEKLMVVQDHVFYK